MACLVSAEELRSELEKGTPLLVLDVRFSLADPHQKERDYQEAHIPGAHYVHLERELSGPVVRDESGRHPLPAPEDFAAVAARLGVDESSRIVVYDDMGGAFAARLWWMLRATGHQDVRVLDGGFPAFVEAGGPVEKEVRPPFSKPPRKLEFARDFIATLATVERLSAARAGGLFDARAPDRFAGENETIDKTPGHIPGAANLPFARNLDGGRFRTASELRSRFLEAFAGVEPKDVVMYCGSGVTACHNLLALELAGLPGARLFPGSYSEWIASGKRPVEL